MFRVQPLGDSSPPKRLLMPHIVEVSNRQNLLPLSPDRFIQAIANVLNGEDIQSSEINVAVVDNATIHETNRQFLQHDYPTDVITFPWNENEDETDKPLQGDIMVSAEMARQVAGEYGWAADDELLLYVIHGTLHLAGYDDHTDDDRAVMRERETHYLDSLGIDISNRVSDATPSLTDKNGGSA